MTRDFSVLDILLYDVPIGTLTHLPGDRNHFAFRDDYLNSAEKPTLSLSFKDRTGDLSTRTRLPSFFSNLLPEGYLREYLSKQAGVNPKHEFALLETLGEDLPGAIKIRKSDAVHDPNKMHFSLAGIQLKFSANWNGHERLTIPARGVGGSWIVKLPSPIYPGVPENEFTMMELAREIGIEVPETRLISVDQIAGIPKELGRIGNHAFAIKRFDRNPLTHIEDFAQVFSVFPEEKYRAASYRNIAEVLWSEIGKEATLEFIRRFVFNALIGNGDMHLKNWSLIYRDQKNPMLAPAYDFVSTIPYLPDDALALKFVDSKLFNSLTTEQFSRFATKANIPRDLVIHAMEETVERFRAVWRKIGDYPLDEEMIDTIVELLKSIPIYNNI